MHRPRSPTNLTWTNATFTPLEETIHSARVIPLDGRPHFGPKLRQWLGDSRGRWEGNTLIVDTVNYTSKTAFRVSRPSVYR